MFLSPSVLFKHCSSKLVYKEVMGWTDWQANCLFLLFFFPPSSSQDPPQLGWISYWHCLSACNFAKCHLFPCNPVSHMFLPCPAPRPHLKSSSRDTFRRGHNQASGLKSELYMCVWSIGSYCIWIYDLHIRWVLFIYWPVQLAEGSIWLDGCRKSGKGCPMKA